MKHKSSNHKKKSYKHIVHNKNVTLEKDWGNEVELTKISETTRAEFVAVDTGCKTVF